MAAFLLAMASAMLFVLTIITEFLLPEALETTGFQLFVLPFAFIALILTLLSRKDQLDLREQKRFKITLLLSITMLIVPIVVYILSS